MHVLPCIRDLQHFLSPQFALLLSRFHNLVCCAHQNSIFFYSLKFVPHSRKDRLCTLLAIRLLILLSNDATNLLVKRSKNAFILFQDYSISKHFLHNHLDINMRLLSKRLFNQFLFNKLVCCLLPSLPIYLQDLSSRLLAQLSVSWIPSKQSIRIYPIQLDARRARNLLQCH